MSDATAMEVQDAIGDMREIKFDVVERPAESLVSRSIYDEQGVIVGQVPEEEYEVALEDAQGKTFFECRAVANMPQIDSDGSKVLVPISVGFRSAIVEREMRGGAMAEMFAAFGSSLFSQFFK